MNTRFAADINPSQPVLRDVFQMTGNPHGCLIVTL